MMVRRCFFLGNTASDYGGGMYCHRSSSTLPSSWTILDCYFSDNQSREGGGLHCGSGSPVLTGCTFSGNSASRCGGGISFWSSSSPTVTNTTFSENAGGFAGGVCCEYLSYPTFTNIIIVFSAQGEAIACRTGSGATLTCCDVYGNASGDWVGCIADQYGVNGNISADPLFCGDLDPDEPYTLQGASPCAAGNNPQCGQIGAWGVGCAVTGVQSATWGSIKAMFR
jgi:parallel beta-helix repeat protein